MKTSTIALLVLAILGAVIIGSCSYGVSINNALVAGQQDAEQKLANVGSALQRRADLLPNVARVVARYAGHEKDTFIKTAEARASAAGSIKLDATTLSDPAKMAQFQAAQGDIQAFMSKLMVVQEQYPQLKADRLFIDLQAQVEGSENRIKVDRDNYNVSVRQYNTLVASFPSSVVASFRNFQKLAYFQVDVTATKAPDLGDVLK